MNIRNWHPNSHEFQKYHIEYQDNCTRCDCTDKFTTYYYNCMTHDFHNFIYQLYNNRYLIIIGGNVYARAENKEYVENGDSCFSVPHIRNLTRIVALDLENFTWLITHQMHNGISQHSSVLTSDNKIYVIGKQQDQIFRGFELKQEMFFKLNLNATRIPWSCERQIWIAFRKNLNNNQCLIHQLPKDVINFILKLSMWTIFEQVHNVLGSSFTCVFPYARHKF